VVTSHPCHLPLYLPLLLGLGQSPSGIEFGAIILVIFLSDLSPHQCPALPGQMPSHKQDRAGWNAVRHHTALDL